MNRIKYDFNIVTPIDACDINYYKRCVLVYQAHVNGLRECMESPECSEGLKAELQMDLNNDLENLRHYEEQVARYV